MPITAAWHRAINRLDGYPHDENKIWRMVNTKVQGATPSEILEIKNNSPKQVDIILIPNPDVFLNMETNPENFHEHYQNLAPTKEKQKQWLVQLNTRLCNYCLIPCDFQYCNKCDLIYNPPICMIYMIPEEKEPISSCTSKSESIFNPDSNSNNNDDKNTGSSSIQYGNKNNSNLDSDPNSEIFIVLPELTKKQELK
ncbi:hypothetical protein G9A89_015041 [Geosiphon pyriformis]|nr:hypothetical protein G9A89_015041 [Geosiphon pyriformis]